MAMTTIHTGTCVQGRQIRHLIVDTFDDIDFTLTHARIVSANYKCTLALGSRDLHHWANYLQVPRWPAMSCALVSVTSHKIRCSKLTYPQPCGMCCTLKL